MTGVLALVIAFALFDLPAIDASDRYRSPRNPERKIRPSTELIVLHTTEAPARSSLNKVSERGECHFCVTEDGSVYRIVDRDREAFHAGRSMWNGREDVDKYSIGIECVGHHNKPMGVVQLRAIAKLVKELQSMYRIPDHCVVCHSHVAYGAPNKWQRNRHRGRKRCGMLFATATIRRMLGLKTRPAFDADVRARRLVVGDPFLEQVLYGRQDVMASYYPSVRAKPQIAAAAPAARPKPAPAARPNPPPTPARPAAAARPVVRCKSVSPAVASAAPPKSAADLKKRGYRMCGVIAPGKSAMKLAGEKWNHPDTYYVTHGKLVNGRAVNPSRLEKGAQVWIR